MNAEHLWSAALAKASSTGSLTGDGDDHMQRMWSRLDVDNSGFLDMDEIKELLSVVRTHRDCWSWLGSEKVRRQQITVHK